MAEPILDTRCVTLEIVLNKFSFHLAFSIFSHEGGSKIASSFEIFCEDLINTADHPRILMALLMPTLAEFVRGKRKKIIQRRRIYKMRKKKNLQFQKESSGKRFQPENDTAVRKAQFCFA